MCLGVKKHGWRRSRPGSNQLWRIYNSSLYSADLGASRAPISALFLYFSGIGSLFPPSQPSSPQPAKKYIICKILIHLTSFRTKLGPLNVKFKRNFLVETDWLKGKWQKQVVFGRLLWNGLSASSVRGSHEYEIQEHLLNDVTFHKS